MSQPTRPHRLIVMVSLALVATLLEPAAAQDLVKRLCDETDCNAAMIQLPRIDSVFFLSNITPGGTILLKGRGLERTTQLTLKLVDFTGQPKTPLVNLLEVGPTFIGARIADGVVGVMDQQAILQVRTGSNQFSNEFPVNFVAERDIRTLEYDDPGVRVVSCGRDSNWDVCNDWHDPDDSKPSGFGGKVGPYTTIGSGHHNCFACVGTDRGEDTYEIVLANGWVLETMDWFDHNQEDEQGATKPSFPAGTSRWRPTIKWFATSDDTANYNIDVHISGPRGVPWR